MNKRILFLTGIMVISLFLYVGSNSTEKEIVELSEKDDEFTQIPEVGSSASDYEYEWNKTWGGIYDDSIDSDNAMAIDSSNNIYLVGHIDTTGTSNYDIALIKCDSQGVEQWVKIWDGGASDQGNSILIDNTNEIYVVGMTTSYTDPDGDMVIIKYDSDGNQQWNFTWGGSELDSARAIVKDSLNNYYIAGETRSFADVDGDAILVKFDSNWIEQWNVTWGGSDTDYARCIEIDHDGDICIVGTSYSVDPSPGYSDIMVLKYNASGTLIWDENWGMSGYQRGNGIAIDSNNNIYIVGHTLTSTMKGYLVKYDTNGNYQWERIWGVTGVIGNSWWGVIIDSNDEIFISGYTSTHGPYSGDGDAIILNYNTSGSQNWYKTWGLPDREYTFCIDMDSKRNLYLAGRTNSLGAGGYDIYLMKYLNTLDPQPQETWDYTGISYYLGAQDIFPEGISWDGTNWWMIGSDNDSVHKYSSDWSYTGISYDISGQCTVATGICWDGTYWWALEDGVFDSVHKYNSDWSYTGISHYIGGSPKGLYWDGVNWWVIKFSPSIVQQFDSEWVSTGISYSLTAQDTYPSDLFWDGAYWWVTGIYSDAVHKYYSNWSYTGISYDTSSQDDYPTDLFLDGTNWWMLGYGTSRVYKYVGSQEFISPVIHFEISDEYLNSTRPMETDLGLQINCSVLDDSPIEWTYLSENSTGIFVNRSMVLGSNGLWSYNVDISSLVEEDILTFSFLANDSNNNIGALNNAGLNFSIIIGDYYREPIYINGNDDFTIQNGVRDPWVEGTENDPYIIEDWIIDAGGFGSAIFIENTTKSFKIENCILNNSGSNIDDAGIRLYNVSNGKIINNNVSNNGRTGIRLLNSINNTISYNIAKNNSNTGIYLGDGSNNNNVTNNIVRDNDGVGIQINSSCDINLIYSNAIVGNIQNNAKDDGSSNNWDNGTIGNYWGDYESTYPNAWNDGYIWDTAYAIPGTTNSYDYHPTDNFLEEDPQYFNFITSSMTYSPGGSYKFNCTWTDEDNAVLEVYIKFNGTFYLVHENFTGEFSFTFNNLPANENGYEYQWLAKDQFNAWNATPINYFLLHKLNAPLSLKFNDTEGDYISKMNQYVNISLLNLNYTPGELQLYFNSTLLCSGTTSIINNLSYYQIPGILNITGILKHQNYTGQITYWMAINEIYPPNIQFQISPLYLSTITPQYNHDLLINCTVTDDSSILWVYLCENSTGSFLNHSMSFINGNYTITLDSGLLNWADTVMFSFYAIDSLGNLKWENNGGLNYSIQIYDFDSPITLVLFDLYFTPYYVNKSIYFSLAAEDYIEFGSAGVNLTYYKIDNGVWEIYNSPFNLSNYQEGLHNISYFTTDLAGNIENHNVLEIYLITEESDIDGDGLTHYEEINIYLTDPFDSDSDDDGLTDEEEVIIFSTNPNLEDTDGDKLTDGEEVLNYNTNPLSRDTDGDGYSDYDEIKIYRTDPNNALSSPTMSIIILIIIIAAISVSSYIGAKKWKTVHRRRVENNVISQILEDEIKVLDCIALNNKLQKVKSSMDFEETTKKENVSGHFIQKRGIFVKDIGIEKLSSIVKEIISEIHIQNLSKQEEGSLIKINLTDLELDERLLEFIKDLKA